MYEIVNRETGKCPLLLLTGLFILSSYLLVLSHLHWHLPSSRVFERRNNWTLLLDVVNTV